MEEQQKEELLEWHPAFFAGLQIELAEDADNLIFENEHHLGTRPKKIDVLIIKKETERPVRKNIGRLFRKYNIVEYKSPDDTLSIDDFYKTYAYACFYKADTGSSNSIPIEDLTITFVCTKYPRKLLTHLRQSRKYTVSAVDKGIFYVKGDFIPIQMILTGQLSEEENLWLKNLTNDIQKVETAQKLISEYGNHKEDTLYKSVMNIIVQANQEKFQEVKTMCEALEALMKDEMDALREKSIREGIAEGLAQGHAEGHAEGLTAGLSEGIKALIETCKELGISREQTALKVKDKLPISEADLQTYMQKYWV